MFGKSTDGRRQPQYPAIIAPEVAAYGGLLYVPSIGALNLFNREALTVTGTAPTITPGVAGIAAKSTAAAAQNTYSGLVGFNASTAGTLFILMRPTAAPSAATFGGIGHEFLNLSYNHTNASFRGVAARRSATAWVTASFGTFTAGAVTAIAVAYDGANLRAVKDGVVVTTASATGSIDNGTVDERVATNAIRSQGYTLGTDVLALWATPRAVDIRLLQRLTREPWRLFTSRRIWVPVSAGGGTTHDTTGVLAGAGAAIAGTAAHKALHSTSGALAGGGSATAGVAERTRAHPTSGVLAGGGGALSGTASRAAGAFEHATTGALAGGGAALSGTAARVAGAVTHATSGVLAGAGGALSGVAAHQALHGTSGALAGGGGQLSGTAAGSGAAVAIGLAGGFDVDIDPILWWQRKPKRIAPEEAKAKLKAVAKVVKAKAEEHAADREPVAQRRADVRHAVAPLVAQMPGFDWRPVYDEAYDRALTAAIAQRMREQEAAQQMEQAIRTARMIDEEEVALLAAML